MRVFPRYEFRETGEPCPHGSPDCLCDVIVTDPVEIMTDGPHLYHQLALGVLDDGKVTERNVYEFFQIVLAADYLYRSEVSTDTDDMIVQTEVLQSTRNGKLVGPPQWHRLPNEVCKNLRRHYKVGTPWELAQRELDGMGYTATDLKVLGKYYNTRRMNALYKSQTKRTTEAIGQCVICGKEMPNKGGQRKTCSQVCRNKKTKMAAKARMKQGDFVE